MQNVMDETNRGFMAQARGKSYTAYAAIFIARIAAIYPDREAAVYHDRRYSWQQTYERCVKLADALIKAGLKKGEVVTIMRPNTPEMVEAHFGVAMAGGVLNTMNTNWIQTRSASIPDHAETRFLLTDTAFQTRWQRRLHRQTQLDNRH